MADKHKARNSYVADQQNSEPLELEAFKRNFSQNEKLEACEQCKRDNPDGLHYFYEEVEDMWHDEHTSVWLARWATDFESLLIGPGEGNALDLLETELCPSDDDAADTDLPTSS